MKTLNDYLDETARAYDFNNFKDTLHAVGRPLIVDIMKEAAEAYAEAKCREQREICARESCVHKSYEEENILNAPLATEVNKLKEHDL